MSVPLFIVDAFTGEPFRGNPAAVCVLAGWPVDGWLQHVASEMNLSETAFLVPQDGGYALRWFTPAVEVDLCGHATLASAHVIWRCLGHDRDEIAFATRSGVLKAARAESCIELDFPLVHEEASAAPAGLVEALGAAPQYVGRNKFDYLVQLDSEAEVRALRPDFARLTQVDCRGVIVTSRSNDPAFDFVSRFFAPASGVAEDPVTGSAHCCLADFWHKRLGRTEFVAYQASARGGVVRVRISGERVRLCGQAVLVLRGELLAPEEPQ